MRATWLGWTQAERCNAIMRENRERIERTKKASTWSEAEGKWKAKTTDTNTVFLDVGKPVDIPMEVAKWLAICEMFPRATGLGREAQHVCFPASLQILEDGRIRVLFQVCREEELPRINFGPVPFIEAYSDELAREALMTRPVFGWVIWPEHRLGQAQVTMHSAITSAKLLAEILLTLLEHLHMIGAKDNDTLRAVFEDGYRQVGHGSRKRLSDGQLASILELADQCRPRLASPPPSLPVDIFPGLEASSSSRSGSPSSEARCADPAKPPLSKIHLEDRIKLYQVRYLPPGSGAAPWFKGKTPFDIRQQAAALSA